MTTYAEGGVRIASAAEFETNHTCTFYESSGTWSYEGESLTFSRDTKEMGVETLVGSGPVTGPIKGTWETSEPHATGYFELTRAQG
ncbi:MAG TPA: hypothetical protein VMA83_10010 [Solirubrobacteraceae bacterium]|nr:hypothetical protein [Solirubrobacteraceae bacterium]